MFIFTIILILADTTMYRTYEEGTETWMRRIVDTSFPQEGEGVLKLVYESPGKNIVAVLDSNYVPIEIKKWYSDTMVYSLIVSDSLYVTKREEKKTLPLKYPFYDRHTLDYVLGKIEEKRLLIFLPERDYEWTRVVYKKDEGRIILKPEHFFFKLFGINFEFWFDTTGTMIRYRDSFDREIKIVE